MPVLSSPAKIEDISPAAKIASLIEEPIKYPPWSGVGEPGPHSISLPQLTTVLKEQNREEWGFYRELLTSLDQERQYLEAQSKSPDITYNQKQAIDNRIQTIYGIIPGEIDDELITRTIVSRPTPQYDLTHLYDKLIETVPAADPKHEILRSWAKTFDRMAEGIPDFLIGTAHTFTYPKDSPFHRDQYDIALNANIVRRGKLESRLKTEPEGLKSRMLRTELERVNEFIDTHPEWKDKEKYPEQALTLVERYWKESSDQIIDEARHDLENAHLVNADQLAYYMWEKEQQLVDWTDPTAWTADAFQYALGSGLASFVPSAAIGIATGFLTSNPAAGLLVGRTAMGIMEGSDEYRQAIDYAIETGLDLDEARHLATYTGVAYGIGSAWMEGWAPGMMMRRLGLMTGKGYSNMFGGALFGNISRKSAGKYAATKRMFGKAVDKIPHFVQAGATEGFQELSQYLYQVSIQAGYKDVGETYIDRYMNVYDVGEAATSTYAGSVLGLTLGLPVGVAARLTKKEKKAVERAEEIRKDVAKVVPLEEVAPEEVVADQLLDYLETLADIKRTPLSPKETPEEGASALEISIYKHKGDKTSFDKLLGLIEDVGKDAVDKIESLSPDNKESILNKVIQRVNTENPDVKLNTPDDAMNYLKAFSQGGERIVTRKKRRGVEKAVIQQITKFDPEKMSKFAEQSLINMGFDPEKAFIKPPEPKAPVPKPPKAPTVPKITKEGKARIGKLGYTPKDVAEMSPERIRQILKRQISKPPVPKPRPPEPGPPKPRPPTPAPPAAVPKVGDEMVVYDAKGNPITAEVTAISDMGTVKITVKGKEHILDMGAYSVQDPKSPDYKIETMEGFEDGMSKASDELIAHTIKRSKEKQDANRDAGNIETALSFARDIRALKNEQARRKEAAPPVAPEVKLPPVAKVTAKDVHKAAEEVGMAWDDDADFMALSKRVTGKERIDDMTSEERANLIAEIRKEVTVVAPPVAPPVKKFVYGEKVEKSLPMNFVYGEGTSLPSRPDVKSKTTFDAILAGERRATSRKDGSLDKLGIGSIVEFYAKGRKEIIKAVVTQKWVPAKIIGPERWSELEGYDEDDVKKNWTSGKKLSEYTQIEFEVLETALAPAIAPKELMNYANKVAAGDKSVKNIYLIGSTAKKGKGKDIDILYDLGKRDVPKWVEDFSDMAEWFFSEISPDNISFKYDNIFKITDQNNKPHYFHIDPKDPMDLGRVMHNQKVIDDIESGVKISLLAAPKKPRLHVIGKDYVDKTPIADKETIQKSLIDIMGKHAPDVQDTFVKEIEENPEAVGRYIDGMVQFILGKATEKTAVHEPIHWFVERVLSQKDYDFLHDKFLTNEAMVEAATDSYMKKKTFRGKVKSLFRKLWNAVKKFLGIKLTSDETVTEMFDRIGVEFDIRRPAVGEPRFYKPKKEPTSDPIEGSESEALREDGADFSREGKVLVGSETDEGYVDSPNEEDEVVGNSYDTDFRSGSLANYQSYFNVAFGRYISKASHAKMINIAQRNKDTSFSQFFAELREWASDNLKNKDGVGVDVEKVYSRQDRNQMKQFYNKANSRVPLFDASTEESRKKTFPGRIFMDVFVVRGRDKDTHLFNYSLTEEITNNPEGNKKRPGFYITNFNEEGDGPLTAHVPMNHIIEVVPNKDYNEKRAEDAANNNVEYSQPKEYYFPANMRIDGGVIRQWDTVFADDYSNKDNPNLMFVAGSKGGNDGVIFLGFVSKDHKDMTADEYRTYLQDEVDQGFMNEEQRLESIEVSDSFYKSNNQIYAQQAGKHEWWKDVEGSNYLIRQRKGKLVNIREHFNRLRIPFAEGTNPLGIKDSRIMLIDSKEVKMNVGGKQVDLFPYAGVYSNDGWLMSSGEWMNDLENNIGRKPGVDGNKLYEIKGFTYDLSEDKVDYLALKMLQMTPFEGTQFTKGGEIIAEVKMDSQTGRSYFVTPEGERFEHIGSDEEAKMIAGKYDRDIEHGGLSEEDGFYKLHTLSSSNFKVLFVSSEYSKSDAAYPSTEGEVSLDKDLIGTPVYDVFMNQLKRYYREVGNSYLDDLFDMHTDEKMLRDELYKDSALGQLPTDLQNYISMISEDGKGIHIPHIVKPSAPYLNNTYINSGMYKVRNRDEMGTLLFTKPLAHLDVEEGGTLISARNTTMYNIAKDLYFGEIPDISFLDDEGMSEAIIRFDARPFIERVEILNNHLSKKPFWVKIWRQPVTGPAVVLMRRVSGIVEGEHGEVIFLTPKDVHRLQADFDGDKIGVMHFKDKNIEKAFVDWHESKELKNRDKTVYTEAFLTDKKQTSMVNYKDFIKSIYETSVASGSQGVVTNSKTIGNVLAFKEIKIKIDNPKRTGPKDWTIEARQPSEEVIMSYAKLDKEALMENDGELYNLLIGQGDKIVSTIGKELALDELAEQRTIYLKTTHEHQMSTLLQFAVDDTSLGMLAKIGYNFVFMTDIMFRNTDGSRMRNVRGIRHALTSLRHIFNYSPTRRGLVDEGKATMGENIVQSQALDRFMKMNKDRQGADITHRINNTKELTSRWYYKGYTVLGVNIRTDRETPIESLLRLLSDKYNNMVSGQDMLRENMLYTSEWSGTPTVFLSQSNKTAHINVMKQLESEWSDTVKEKGVTKEDMSKGADFALRVDKAFRKVFIGIKTTRVGKFIEPKVEHNEQLRDLVDQYINEWNALSENAQIYSTLYFLSGTTTRSKLNKPAKRVNIERLLPSDLMHKETFVKYAETWWEMLNKPSDSSFKQPRDTRGIYYKDFKFKAALRIARDKSDEACG